MSDSRQRATPMVAIIDDEEDIATFLALGLEDHGFHVVSTTDSAAALPLLESTKPDVICLDLLMPEQTGVSLYRAIMAHPQLARAQVIVLSGLAARDELPDILGCEGDVPKRLVFIEKPVNIEEFLRAVNRALDESAEDRP